MSVIDFAIKCFVTGMALYQITNQSNGSLIYLVQSVIWVIVFIPPGFVAIIGSELKKRSQNS